MIKLKSLIETYNNYLKLFESPVRIPPWNVSELDDRNSNFAYTKIVIEKGKKVGNFENKYEIYEYSNGNNIINIFVGGEFTHAFFKFSINNNMFNEKHVWQDSLSLGLCRKILFEYYLDKYQRIISDGLHTEFGERYWKKLLQQAISEKHKVYVLNSKNETIEIDNVESLDKFYGNTMESEKVRFVIEK
jgi:hypothetical protein